MLLQYIRGRGSSWICFAGYSILICLFVILSRIYCFLKKQRKTEYWKFRWNEVRWEQEWKPLFSHSFSTTPLHLSELSLHLLTFSATFATYSHCLGITNSAVRFKGGASLWQPLAFCQSSNWQTTQFEVEGTQEGKGDSQDENVWLHKNYVTVKINELKHDKWAGSYLPKELPCLGKQALPLARRETCQGLICVFVHRRASKHTRTLSTYVHMTIRKELLWDNSTFSTLQLLNALYMHNNLFTRVNIVWEMVTYE